MTAFRRLGRGEVRRLLDEHDLAPVKAFGQNFVIDPNTVDRIARLAAIGQGDNVLEIGAGLGSLTVALAATGARVVAVEIDRRLVGLLRENVPEPVEVVEADAMHVDFAAMLGLDRSGERAASAARDRWILVANLPYNVATPLVVTLLQTVPEIARMLVMVQREAGERFAASPGTKEYGAVSVRVAYFATARLVGRVSPEVFFPRPNVESSLIAIERRPEPAVDPGVASFEEIDRLVRAGFGGRRKMLRRSLSGLVDEDTFARAGVDSTVRVENLEVRAWGMLAGCLKTSGSSPTPS